MNKIILLLPLISLALCLPSQEVPELKPEFRSGIFDATSGKSYDWGYVISPSRGHAEQRDGEGVVTGIVSFVNAEGNKVRWSYTAHPQHGFRVTEYKEYSNAVNPFIDPHTLVINTRPLLKNAQTLGYVRAEGFDDDQAQFKVDDEVARAAGSESQLAHNLGAIPVAAVHDVRAPPSSRAPEQTGPVLVAKHPGSIHQDSSNYFLLVPVNNY